LQALRDGHKAATGGGGFHFHTYSVRSRQVRGKKIPSIEIGAAHRRTTSTLSPISQGLLCPPLSRPRAASSTTSHHHTSPPPFRTLTLSCKKARPHPRPTTQPRLPVRYLHLHVGRPSCSVQVPHTRIQSDRCLCIPAFRPSAGSSCLGAYAGILRTSYSIHICPPVRSPRRRAPREVQSLLQSPSSSRRQRASMTSRCEMHNTSDHQNYRATCVSIRRAGFLPGSCRATVPDSRKKKATTQEAREQKLTECWQKNIGPLAKRPTLVHKIQR